MNRVLWIGPQPIPSKLGTLLAERELELLSFPSADAALESLKDPKVAVAIVTSDWADAPDAVKQLATQRSDLQIVLASDAGIPRHALLSLWAGAAGLLELKTQSREEIVREIGEWVNRHTQRERELELLRRMHALNDEFLKKVVTSQKRVLDLEAKLDPDARKLDPFEGGAQILIVDDEEVVHDVLRRILEGKGHHITSAMTGQDAVAAVSERPFHLVITDKNLPDWSGLNVLKQVKGISPDTEVMMITGYASKETVIQAMDLGAVAYLEKPFEDIRAVLERVEGVLRKQHHELTSRHHLNAIKERNREFLDHYRAIRSDLEVWIGTRGKSRL